MFYGMCSEEALTDTSILESLKTLQETTDYQPDSEDSEYWHRHLLSIEDSQIESVVNKIAPIMQEGWYSIYWNNDLVYVVFNNMVFKLKKEINWSSNQYKDVRNYAITHGVQEEYFDLNERFEYYEGLIANLQKK